MPSSTPAATKPGHQGGPDAKDGAETFESAVCRLGRLQWQLGIQRTVRQPGDTETHQRAWAGGSTPPGARSQPLPSTQTTPRPAQAELEWPGPDVSSFFWARGRWVHGIRNAPGDKGIPRPGKTMPFRSSVRPTYRRSTASTRGRPKADRQARQLQRLVSQARARGRHRCQS